MKLRAICQTMLLAGVVTVSSFAGAADKPYVPVISKGFMHEFWQTVKMGSDDAADKLGLKTTFDGPSDETQIDQQIQLVENALAKRPSGLMLAALDANALLPSVHTAHDRHIPIVTFDSGVNSEIPATFVATNNRKAGAMAGDAMGQLIKGKGKVGVIAHNAGTTSAIDRSEGFINLISQKYPDIKLLDILYSDGDPQKAMNQAMDIIRANPDLTAIYATNEGSTTGVATAIQSLGLGGKIKVIGFDTTEAILQFIRDDVMQGVIVQDAYQIGYQGMMALDKVMKGESIEKQIDIPAVLVTTKNIDDKSIQKVVKPLG